MPDTGYSSTGPVADRIALDKKNPESKIYPNQNDRIVDDRASPTAPKAVEDMEEWVRQLLRQESDRDTVHADWLRQLVRSHEHPDTQLHKPMGERVPEEESPTNPRGSFSYQAKRTYPLLHGPTYGGNPLAKLARDIMAKHGYSPSDDDGE